MRLYYLGPQGTFSYLAAAQYTATHDHTYDYVAKSNLYDVVHAVATDDQAIALVPIENSIEGTINIVADALTEKALYAIDEVHLSIQFALYGLPGTQLSDIEHVTSIAPAISQTHHFIQKQQWTYDYVDSTMQGFAHISKTCAAIAPMGVDASQGFVPLATAIEDYPHNMTRFLVLSQHPNQTTQPTDMLLLITPKLDKPGLLASVLNTFSLFNINLSWIASRPMKTQLGHYRFFVQVDVDDKQHDMHKVITILNTLDFDVKILGAFQKDI